MTDVLGHGGTRLWGAHQAPELSCTGGHMLTRFARVVKFRGAQVLYRHAATVTLKVGVEGTEHGPS